MILVTQIPILMARLKAALESGCSQDTARQDPDTVRLLVERLEQLGYRVSLERVAA